MEAREAVLKSVRDPDRGRRNLAGLAAHLGTPAFDELIPVISRLLPRTADPDMALNNLERLLARPPARKYLAQLVESRARGLDAVLQLLSTSQYFADTLAAYPEFIESVRNPLRRNPSTAELKQQLRSEVDASTDDAGALSAFRRFRHRHALRIGTSDVIRDRPLEEVTRDLARLADASIEVALHYSLRLVAARFGTPAAPGGRTARLSVLAFGKLGGDELNYSSDIDLLFIYDHEGETVGKRTGVTNSEFFARVVTEIVRVLSTHTDRGFAYRVDLRLRPEGNRGPLARSVASTLSYYDTMGRTWERQSLIKLRHVAGDPGLAQDFLSAIEPFIYRKYFSFSEINEVKALKRQMEVRAAGSAGEGFDAAPTDVKTGRGGIRDIEYTVQFLQLLNGGDLPAVRQRNTLLALDALEIAGCLNPQETFILADAYRFLRKTEHRLQLLFDLQTHRLPTSPDELRKLSRRMGYSERPSSSLRGAEHGPRYPDPAIPELPADARPQKRSPLDESSPPVLDTRDLLVDPLDQFLKDLHDKTALDRTILNHLLHQAFADEDVPGAGEPEADLILDPHPDEATIRTVLGRYPLRDPIQAYGNLTHLARESVPFLSSRRCRHFLASIAPQLLRSVSDAPDPDEALTQLERVSASLGAKAVLWELFSQNPPILRLYVDLCASSPYLSGLLINNPGMIDELLDSLVLNQPRTAAELRSELTELCRGASDTDPILHSFQDKELLRIGVGDLLGKADVRITTAALSDVAETLLNQVIDLVEPAVQEKYGVPMIGARPCRYALLGLGKLGGREISYHSDLDLLLLYESGGDTTAGEPNAIYFTELAQRLIRMMSRMGPMGRLYEVDMRLRPTGKSGSLVLPLAEFHRYFEGPAAQLWERQSLSRARVVRADPGFADEVTAATRSAMLGKPWNSALADEIRTMRQKLEATARPRSLKRGPGGIVDVEFIVQFLILKYGRAHPETACPNIWDALNALLRAGILGEDDAMVLSAGYSFLRLIEARVRIVTDRALTEVPESAEDRAKLARRLGFDSPDSFLAELARTRSEIRRRYDAITTLE